MPAQPTDTELYLLSLVNATRAEKGASTLIFDGELNAAADSHSKWLDTTEPPSLVTQGENPHIGANHSTPATRITEAGYEALGGLVGENIYFFYGTDETGATAAAT